MENKLDLETVENVSENAFLRYFIQSDYGDRIQKCLIRFDLLLEKFVFLNRCMHVRNDKNCYRVEKYCVSTSFVIRNVRPRSILPKSLAI